MENTEELKEMILREIDAAIRNQFQMQPGILTFEDLNEAWRLRNEVAVLFGLNAKP